MIDYTIDVDAHILILTLTDVTFTSTLT